MKHTLLLILVTILSAVRLHADEVVYYNKPWKEVLAKAKAEHKYIFIDCYTDWCSWCKVMDKETMTNTEVIKLLGDNFIAVKMEMEHGEGIAMSMKYHITGFPSFLFFNSDGEYVYHTSGYQKSPDFLGELKGVLDKTKQTAAPGFSKSMNVGYPDFYKNSFVENGKRTFPKQEEVVAFLDKQQDLFSEVSWAVIARYDAGDKYTRHFLDNVPRYRQLFGKTGVNDKLNTLLGSLLATATKNKDEKAFDNLLPMLDKYMGDEAPNARVYCSLSFYKAIKDWNRYGMACNEFVLRNGFGKTTEINSFCWDIYENSDDKKLLASACKWMAEVVSLDASYPNLDTYASLLYKTGQISDAKTMAVKAVAIGKAAGSDVKATEELLQKMETK